VITHYPPTSICFHDVITKSFITHTTRCVINCQFECSLFATLRPSIGNCGQDVLLAFASCPRLSPFFAVFRLLPSDSLPSRDFLKGELVKISAFVAFFSRRLCLAGTVDKVTDPECSALIFFSTREREVDISVGYCFWVRQTWLHLHITSKYYSAYLLLLTGDAQYIFSMWTTTDCSPASCSFISACIIKPN